MINETVDGISIRLHQIFGDDVEIYTEKTKQGLKEPCFAVRCVRASSTPVVGNRYFWQQLFEVRYHPKSGTDAQAECLTAKEKLLVGMEYIVGDDSLMRGTDRSAEIVDGVVVFSAYYNCYAKQATVPAPAMERMSSTTRTKG